MRRSLEEIENVDLATSSPSPSWFLAGEHKFVFLKRDPLLLVTVSRTQEPYPHVRT